jgi:hypothetical protein
MAARCALAHRLARFLKPPSMIRRLSLLLEYETAGYAFRRLLLSQDNLVSSAFFDVSHTLLVDWTLLDHRQQDP